MIETWTPQNHPIPGFGVPVTVDLSAYAGEPVVYIAFRYVGDWADDWFIDDVSVFEPSDHDVKAVAALPNDEQFAGGATVYPQAVVSNVGLNPEAFDVLVEISESSLPFYSETMTVTGLMPGTEVTVDFPSVTVNAGNFYPITVTTLLPGDEDPANDVATGFFDTYTQTHVPLGILFTNSGCGPCVAANQALDAYIPTAGNSVALLRVHTWWPNPNDIMYTANVEQCTYLTNQYGVSGVPNFFIDRFWDLGSSAAGMIAGFDEAKTWKSPMEIDLVWTPGGDFLQVCIDVINPLPPGDYRLFCSITEDNIEHDGGNGEHWHQQAFRRMYPDCIDGIGVPSTIGVHDFHVACPLDPTWVYEELRASVHVIDTSRRKIWQAGTGFLTELEDYAAVDGEAKPAMTRLGNVVPNPLNPQTTVHYALAQSGPVKLAIYDVAGRLVRTLVDGVVGAGEFGAVWDGKDAAGQQVAPSIYFVRFQADGRTESRKIVLSE